MQRARLNGNVTSAMGPFNEFPNITRDGFMVLSGVPNAFTNAGCRAPFTRLHLIDQASSTTDPIVYSQQHGFRPWQRNGITFTGNSDQSYIGHKYDANDNTDFVVQWSDNPNGSPWGVDRFKFVFTTRFNAGQSRGAASTYGLEAFRLWPRDNFQVNVGIGDFFAGNQLTPATVVDPTERLDILTGRLRIRDLPTNPAATDSFYVMVVDRTTLIPGNQERGVVKWVDPSSLGGCSSGWTLNGTDAVTAYNGNPCPPQAADRVGIGATFPLLGKLHVEHASTGAAHVGVYTKVTGGTTATAFQSVTSGASSNRGVFASVTGGANTLGVIGGASGATTNNMAGQFQASGGLYGVGVEAISQGSSSLSRGVKASAANGTNTYGVDALGQILAGSATDVFGVRGVAESYSNATRTVGVYGDNAGTAGPNTWAMWSDGFALSLGGPNWVPSDQELKTDIEEVTNASELLAQLTPKSYRYNGEAFPFMAFNQGRHYGIMAQELEQVLPDAVRDVIRPADLDEEGQVLVPEARFKAVNHEALVPLLIASNKEQQRRIERLEEMVAACCANGMVDPSMRGNAENAGAEDAFQEKNGRMRIVPNPFSEPPTVFYTMEAKGRAQLLASASDGRGLKVLQEGTLEKGEYQFVWDTANLAPGMYYVSLLVDGETVVQKAVKVTR